MKSLFFKNKAHSTTIGDCRQDKIFDGINMVIMTFMLLAFLWPLWFVIIASFSDPSAVWAGEVLFVPKGFSLDGYIEVLKYDRIWLGYKNTIIYTVVGTTINVVMTLLAAYPLSCRSFPARKVLLPFVMVTMYFSGGLIPTYLVVRKLGMVNTIWAMVLPHAISVFNMIIARTYFATSIPDALREAAELDGAGTMKFFTSIVIPLSAPIIAVIALYYGVGHWNTFFQALIYINDVDKMPLQLFLRDLLISEQDLASSVSGTDPDEILRKMQLADTMKYSIIIIAAFPMLCVYPFIQRFFVKGVMVGSVKG